MTEDKINLYLMTNMKYFPSERIPYIKQQLERIDDSKLIYLQTMSYKDPVILLIISIVAGSLGIDRFMLGQIGLGIAKLLTCGGLGLWTLIDWFLIMGQAKEKNFEEFMKIISTV
ncbi:MAG: TM2 domain-containing protein [Ignavibacteriaceae bacterium]|nr:TM2 domain-containing protein [Ignavibacteriaceae bacterium]NUM70594.1 TM2 domain-containing protein [Ignavibacteriaceae bacterium]